MDLILDCHEIWFEYLLIVRKYNSMVRDSYFFIIILGGDKDASVSIPQ